VLPGGVAERAGLREGDRILSVDGKPVETWDALVAEIRAHPGRDIALAVRRTAPGEGAPPLSVTARPDDAGGIGRIGVAQNTLAEKVGAGAAPSAAVRATNAKAGEILSGLAQVVTRKQKGEFMGPLGILLEMARSARAGPSRFFTMVWVISILLALFNLLPIPALDGGRLVFLAYEIATRRRVNQKIENYVHLAGFLALAGLLLAVTLFGDLARIFRR
jgi:regulator of sigma E protease